MDITMIAAIGCNNEMGKDNDLPWHIPADMAHFKKATTGKSVIMGRNTYESIGCKPLPNRQNIVLTRNTSYSADNVDVATTVDQALFLCYNDIMIIGGSQIYAEFMQFANKLIITHVNKTIDADCFFPKIDSSWQRSDIASNEEFTIAEYIR